MLKQSVTVLACYVDDVLDLKAAQSQLSDLETLIEKLETQLPMACYHSHPHVSTVVISRGWQFQSCVIK